ncbi:MAG: response regulator transcription factor [Candidatus Aquicultorales bacterium]
MSFSELLMKNPSGLITALIALAFLWLALYIVRVDHEDSEAKLAAAAMVSVFLYLLGDFMVGTLTDVYYIRLYRGALWWLPFAPVFWLHLSQKVTERRDAVSSSGFTCNALTLMRSPGFLGSLYGAAALFAVAGAFTDSLFAYSSIKETGLPVLHGNLPTGPVYVLFAVFVVVVSGVAWLNFLEAWGDEGWAPGSRFKWLSLGGLLFWISSGGLLIKSLWQVKLEYPLGNMVLGAGMAIVGLAILHRNALVKKEELERDVIYTSVGALGIATIYALSLFFGQGGTGEVAASTVMIVASLALTTHMLADVLKVWFGKLIGTRVGLVTDGQVQEMENLYSEASRIKRRHAPLVDLFEDGDDTAERLLSLLTPRQREIITLRAKGLSDKQIAEAAGIKLPTVHKHIEDIKSRIGSRDKADCAIYCLVTGLLSKEDLGDWFDSLNIEGSKTF